MIVLSYRVTRGKRSKLSLKKEISSTWFCKNYFFSAERNPNKEGRESIYLKIKEEKGEFGRNGFF